MFPLTPVAQNTSCPTITGPDPGAKLYTYLSTDRRTIINTNIFAHSQPNGQMRAKKVRDTLTVFKISFLFRPASAKLPKWRRVANRKIALFCREICDPRMYSQHMRQQYSGRLDFHDVFAALDGPNRLGTKQKTAFECNNLCVCPHW